MTAVTKREISHRMEAFRQKCLEKGLAFTHQRQVIYRALAAAHNHPTPEAVYEKVRAEMPSISLGTVYKNIKTFTEAGLLNEVSPLHESLRLDANLEPHHHLICTVCKSVEDLPVEAVEPVRTTNALPNGFAVSRYSVELLGVCARCSAN